MTKDIQRAILRACARFIGRKVEPVEKRLREVEQATADLIQKGEVADLRVALERRIGEVEQAKLLPGPKGDPGADGARGEKGDPGDPGRDGKDAEPVDLDLIIDGVVAKLLASERLKTLADVSAGAAVAEHFEANPVQHGRDGKDGADGRDGADGERGPQGEKGDPGAAGVDGKDGVGLADALIDRDGVLVLTMTDGRAKTLGVVIGRDGAAGADGRDGLSMVDVSRIYDAENHEVVERWTVAGEAKELRYPAGGIRPGGFWREGMKCFALQAITHDGALWIAKRDTAARPCLENADDWQLAARKGRDGRDGKDGKPPPGPVSLKKPEDGNGA